MTTYDDADLFSDAFTGFHGEAPTTRRPRPLTVLALSVAALLVAGALVWVRLGTQEPAAHVADPAGLVPALAQTQRAADVIAPGDLDDLVIDTASTRVLLADDTASYFVATAPGNRLCLVSIPLGDLAQAACASTAAAPSALRIDGVALVPTGATAPVGWHEAAANVFTEG